MYHLMTIPKVDNFKDGLLLRLQMHFQMLKLARNKCSSAVIDRCQPNRLEGFGLSFSNGMEIKYQCPSARRHRFYRSVYVLLIGSIMCLKQFICFVV